MNPTESPLYLNPARPVEERVQDLIGRMTLDEKISQLVSDSRAIPRLGIPAYNWWSEGLHGIARNGRATVFPQAIGLAATFDTALVQRVAAATADEGRAKHHAAVRRNGTSRGAQGLTLWSPNVNLFRDPRWGRGQETFGEDPFLTGEMGLAFVRGLQGDDSKYLKTAACAKHFAVHSGPEGERHHFNARVSRRDLYDTYLPAFKALVTQGKVEAVMGAYNRVNGEPCCASQVLLVDILRGEWRFQGHVVSDCWALTDIHAHHKNTADAVETAALALSRGCDLSCGGDAFDQLGQALERGLITQAHIDRALGRLLTTRFKLGMFDPPEQVPFTSIPLSVVNSPAHRDLAYEAACKSVVLLKNQNGLLPLRPDLRTLFVTGPNAANGDVLLGNYYGVSESLTTLLEGLAGRAPEGMRVDYRIGCQLNQPNANPLNYALFEGQGADVVVAGMGLSLLLEGEEGEAILSTQKGDRSDLRLPQSQVEYLKQLAATGVKIALVLFGGSPIALGEVEDLVQAIVFVWYPGQEGGRAIADILFGDVAPSGKLPITFPKSVDQLPPFEDYAMKGRTYRYMAAEPLYPFGFGLNYTRFAYGDLKLSQAQIAPGESLEIQFTLTNAGEFKGEEVAQLYLSDLIASVPVPFHKLIGFQRVPLAPAERRTLKFTITPEMMMFVDDEGKHKLEPGEFRITVGGCSPGAQGPALGAPEPLTAKFILISQV